MAIHDLVREMEPDIVVIDPITDFISIGSELEVKSTVTRLIDHLKTLGITTMLTSITAEEHSVDQSLVGVSSLIDTWMSVRNLEDSGERRRGIFIPKIARHAPFE